MSSYDYVSQSQYAGNRPLIQDFGEGIMNSVTGNLDYQRELESMGYQNAFSAEQARLSRDWSSREAELTRQFNSAEARLNREWQEMMSNTSYQRMVQDMQKAGLNPYLAYSQGGASTPVGSSASSTNPSSATAQATNTKSNAKAGQAVNTLINGLFKIAGTAIGLSGTAVAGKTTIKGFG